MIIRNRRWNVGIGAAVALAAVLFDSDPAAAQFTGGCCFPGGECVGGPPDLCLREPGGSPVAGCLGDLNGDGADDACVPPLFCCFPDGFCGEELFPGECAEAQGGGGVLVDDCAACPGPGLIVPCCLTGGECTPLSRFECADLGFQVEACRGDQDGDGQDDVCSPPTPIDCCLPTGECERSFVNDCAERRGRPVASCIECQAPTIKCCRPNGICEDLLPSDCEQVEGGGGVPVEDCATCPGPQERVSCCLTGGQCTELTRFECADLGFEVETCLGDSDNDGEDDACTPPTPTVCNSCVVGQVVCNQPLTGTLGAGDCRISDGTLFDTYEFNHNGNGSLRINLASNSFDTLLVVLDANCNPIAQNDDCTPGQITLSCIQLETLPAGSYFIGVNTFLAGESGNYTLTVDCDLDDRITCCTPFGPCQRLTPAECLNSGGQPSPFAECRGDGNGNQIDDGCETIFPPVNCCLGDNRCQVLTASVCGQLGGREVESCELCQPVPPNACCLPQGRCEDIPPGQCNLLGGTPVGDCLFCVPPGQDCWSTECGRTEFDFCTSPIPAGFFGPGSEPFDGEVQLRGATDGTDTIVQRFNTMAFGADTPVQSTQIELVELSLVSCEPITVVIEGQETQWDVAVGLSDVQPPAGSMVVTKTHPGGGTFTSEFFVQPVFTFTQVNNPNQVVVLDTGGRGIPASKFDSVQAAPWSHQVLVQPTNQVCGVNFAPGFESDPDEVSECTTEVQCCKPVGHAGPGHLHVTGQSCAPCECGACCLPNGNCRRVIATDTQSAAEVCRSLGGEYKGEGTTCDDTDGDGIPDAFETSDCCGDPAERDLCNTGTDPNNPDTDGDGTSDGDELAQGTDPCVPDAGITIDAGDDRFMTPCGGASFTVVCIPPGFFGPGSDEFRGRINWGGQSLNPTVGDPTDTIVRRLENAEVNLDAPATIPIEIVALSLTSCEPIVVTFDGGQRAQEWNCRAGLSSLPQKQGSMTIRLDDDEGGTFTASLPVLAAITFVGPGGRTQTLDRGALGMDPSVFETRNGHWKTSAPASLGIIPGPNDPADKNFFPGVRTVCPDDEPKKTLTMEEAMLEAHGVLPPQRCIRGGPRDPDADGLCNDADNCPDIANGDQADCDGDGVGDVCDNCECVFNPCQEDANGNGIGDACEGPAPAFRHIMGGLGAAPNEFISPLGEDCPFREITLTANRALELVKWTAEYTGCPPIPAIVGFRHEGEGLHTITLDRGPWPGEWLTLWLKLRDPRTGQCITVHLKVAHQPLDINQDGCTDIGDATAFGTEFRLGRRRALIDLNCDGVVNVQDATAFGSNWFGRPPATKPWRNTCVHDR